MPTPIETCLHTLLPTVHSLPPELVALSTSLLAQSRAKAASLKAEEEIGRTYACCHIACQRLGHKLALEIAKPAPPVQPRVYNKLHTYFNTVLTTPKTPRKVDRVSKNADGQKSEERGRSGAGSAKQPTTPTSNNKRKADVLQENELPEMPKFVGSMIRGMAENYGIKDVIPHVNAGVESVFPTRASHESVPKRRRTGNRNTDPSLPIDSLPAIICVVFNAVAEKMDVAREAGITLENDIIVYTHAFLSQNVDKVPLFLPTQQELASEVAQMRKERESEWLDLEWYQNVPLPDGVLHTTGDGGAPEQLDERSTAKSNSKKTPLRRKEKHGKATQNGDAEEVVGAAGLLPGLGTMFQPSLDWLSDEKRAHFAQWRKSILHEVNRMETQQA